MGREQLQALIAVAAVASFVVVVHFSSKLAAPTTVLGWPRDVFGLYNYNYGSLQASEQAAPQYGPEYRMYSADSRLANRAMHQKRGSGMQSAWGNMRSQQAIAQSGEGEREFIERAQQVPRGWAVRDIQKWAQPQVETREGSMSLLRHAHIPNALAYADARHSAPSFTHHADIQWNKRHTKFHRKSDRYNTWEGDQSWKKFQDYKDESALNRLKYAEQRQASIMGKILKEHKPAGSRPGLGSLFTQGLPENHPGLNFDLKTPL